MRRWSTSRGASAARATSCASSNSWTSVPPTAGAWTMWCRRRRSCGPSPSTSRLPQRPPLPHAARPATCTVDACDESGELVPTPIAGEHPLTLYVDKQEVVTLMTLGAAPEALVIGFLRNQRLVKSLDEIVSVQ